MNNLGRNFEFDYSIHESKNEDEVAEVLSDATFVSKSSGESGAPGVKEMDWSAFYSDLNQNDINGMGYDSYTRPQFANGDMQRMRVLSAVRGHMELHIQPRNYPAFNYYHENLDSHSLNCDLSGLYDHDLVNNVYSGGRSFNGYRPQNGSNMPYEMGNGNHLNLNRNDYRLHVNFQYKEPTPSINGINGSNNSVSLVSYSSRNSSIHRSRQCFNYSSFEDLGNEVKNNSLLYANKQNMTYKQPVDKRRKRVADLLANLPKFLRNHFVGVTALALSPNSTCLASGSLHHSVKLYKFPGGDFETNITRFTLPICALAFNKSGTILAAAGDDEGIKLVNTVDGTIARVLKGHKGSITSLVFDPKSEYMASLDSIGTVIYWELQSGSTLHVLKAIAPNNGSDGSVMNILAWSPDGEMLAVAGLKNDVVLYDRDTAEKLFSLQGDHLQPICFLSWSPNGKYMATSGLDRHIFIWDVDKKQDIDRQKINECISCMAWKPHGNALVVIDVMGKYGVWESAVPSSMKSPTEDIPGLHSKNGNGFLLFDEEEEPSALGSLRDLNEDSHGESLPPCRKGYANSLNMTMTGKKIIMMIWNPF